MLLNGYRHIDKLFIQYPEELKNQQTKRNGKHINLNHSQEIAEATMSPQRANPPINFSRELVLSSRYDNYNYLTEREKNSKLLATSKLLNEIDE